MRWKVAVKKSIQSQANDNISVARERLYSSLREDCFPASALTFSAAEKELATLIKQGKSTLSLRQSWLRIGGLMALGCAFLLVVFIAMHERSSLLHSLTKQSHWEPETLAPIPPHTDSPPLLDKNSVKSISILEDELVVWEGRLHHFPEALEYLEDKPLGLSVAVLSYQTDTIFEEDSEQAREDIQSPLGETEK